MFAQDFRLVHEAYVHSEHAKARRVPQQTCGLLADTRRAWQLWQSVLCTGLQGEHTVFIYTPVQGERTPYCHTIYILSPEHLEAFHLLEFDAVHRPGGVLGVLPAVELHDGAITLTCL